MLRRACVAAILLAQTAHAFVPGDETALVVTTGTQPRAIRHVEATRVGAWSATRDVDTRAITQVWGSFVEVPGASRDAAIAERAARAFLAQHLLPAGTRIEDFVVSANRVDGDQRTVAFHQTWNGMRVVGGQMHVVFAHDRLFFAGSDALPNVAAIGRGDVVLPIVRAGGVEYRVARVVERGGVTEYVAPGGAPIARRSRLRHATSTLVLDVGKRYASGPRELRPASALALVVDGSPMTTLNEGTFGWAGGAPASVVTSMHGPEIRIFDGAGPEASATLTAQPGAPVTWSAASDERIDAQLHAFAYVTAAKAIARRIDPALAWLDEPIGVHVNDAQTCNAFSSGDDIFFFRADAFCENTARVADIVHHEFGHSFHAHEVIPGAGGMDDSITEGVADFFAANVTGDSGIGRGLAYDNKAVRELEPIGSERVFPRDLTNISHFTGLIIGGTLWDLRTALIAARGEASGIAATERVFRGILQRASDVTMTYTAALVADDDDGDLGNGTPNFCAITRVFGRHGLAPLEETRLVTRLDGQRVTVTVDTPSSATCPAVGVIAMTLVSGIRDAGETTELAMAASGATWSAELPAYPEGSVVEYQIVATLDTTETRTLPDNPADPKYQTFIGTPIELWCERFDVDPAWTITGAPEWDVGAAKPANAAAGDADVAFSGAQWLGTDLAGNGRYRPDILTSIATPAIDASSYGTVRLQFRRWLAIEDAALDVATIRVNGQQIWANASNAGFSLDHIDREWRFVDFDITDHAREPVSIAFTLASDPFRELGGWNLDDICIVAFDKKAVCGDGVVDPGEVCDGDPDCDKPCKREGAGCCSASGGPWSSLLLAQFVMIFVFRRASRRRPSRSVSERMP